LGLIVSNPNLSPLTFKASLRVASIKLAALIRRKAMGLAEAVLEETLDLFAAPGLLSRLGLARR
jgi:hypothetical protein